MISVPFNQPYITNASRKYVKECLEGSRTQAGGFYSTEVEKILTRLHAGSQAFLTSSGTQALEFASLLLEFRPGDEVIVPAFTFTSAITALINFGVKPVFVDISLDDLNIDVTKIESVITRKTVAISIVNYGGNGANLSYLKNFAQSRSLFLIEDNAHGLSGKMNGVPLGTFGDLSILSFHETKNYQCGEGGALIVNNESLINRAHILREKGTDRRKFLLGEVQKYEWMDAGGSFLLGEILSAYLLGQFDEFDEIHSRRRKAVSYYHERLSQKLFDSDGFKSMTRNEESSFHNYWLLVPSKFRPELIHHMRNAGVQVSAHYQNLATSHGSRKFKVENLETQNSSFAADSLIRLPLFNNISEEQIDLTCEALIEFIEKSSA